MKKLTKFILCLSLILLLPNLGYATQLKIRDGYTVNISDSLKLRDAKDLSKVINSLSPGQAVKVLDKKIKTYMGEQYLFVAIVDFHPACNDNPPEDWGAWDRILTDEEFWKHRKAFIDTCIKKTPKYMGEPMPKDWQFFVLKPEARKGYAALKFLKGFEIPSSFTEAHEQAVGNKGYRIISPLDIGQEHQEGRYRPFFFNDHFYLRFYKENFQKSDLKKVTLFKSSSKGKSYKPVFQLPKGQFLLHLTPKNKFVSVFAVLSKNKKLTVLKKYNDELSSGLAKDYFTVIPAGLPIPPRVDFLYNNSFENVNEDMLEMPTANRKILSPLFCKKKTCNKKFLAKEFEKYKGFHKQVEYSFVVFKNAFLPGDVNPMPPDGEILCVDVYYKLKKAKLVSTYEKCLKY